MRKKRRKKNRFQEKFETLNMVISVGKITWLVVQVGLFVQYLGSWEMNPLFWPWWLCLCLSVLLAASCRDLEKRAQ